MGKSGVVAGDLIKALAEHRRCARRAWLKQQGRARALESPPPSWDLSPAVAAQWPHATTVAAAPDAATQTRHHLNAGRAVRDAVFEYDGGWVRVDLVDGQRLVGVTAATRPRRLWDLAVKLWLVEQTGHVVREVGLACVDPRFVYNGDLRGLLVEHDVTKRVRALSARVPEWLDAMRRDLAGPEPDRTSTQCRRPFACGFLPYCESTPAADYPVTALRAAPGLVRTLQEAGFDDLREVPANRLRQPRHQRIRQAAISGRIEMDDALVAFARNLAYPHTFLDFEAVQFALPRWHGTRPYQALPFQWASVTEWAPGDVRVDGFLDVSGQPPMRDCAQRLLEAVPASGAIVVYGGFERDTLTLLGRLEPTLAEPLAALRERLVDLLPWLQKHFYHRDMQGAWSLKAILAALDLDRETTLTDGLAAQRAYLEAIEPTTTPSRRAQLAEQLRAYCTADAEGMRALVQRIAASS